MSTGEPIRRQVKLAHRSGLHLSPISRVVQEASKFESEVRILFDDKVADARSTMELMLLGATFKAELTLEVTGSDAEAAIEAVALVLETA